MVAHAPGFLRVLSRDAPHRDRRARRCCGVAILVPSLANRLAHVIGVDRGVNLIVYGLVVALIAQMVTAYRREARMEARVAALARALALAGVRPPDEAVVSTGDHSPETRDPQQVEHAASPPHSPTKTTDNDMVTSDE